MKINLCTTVSPHKPFVPGELKTAEITSFKAIPAAPKTK